ncbi:MAG: UbiD family decarboxylase, partial [Candidatus Schekmanbacteria bacterium]
EENLFMGNAKKTGPYDSMREYITALEERGKVLRIKEIDQDRYEGTAFVYRMIEKMGADRCPALIFEKVKINGKWMDGPVIANHFCGWETAALLFGVEDVTDDSGAMYRAVMNKLTSFVDDNGKWKKIKPVEYKGEKAPCKEVVLKGDDVDIYKFPWFKNNPGDAAQYINTGAVFMEDPELGRNVGTYRVQVKGKNKVGMNTEPGQHGWHFVMRAVRRGKKSIPAAIALGVDPVVYSMASTKVADLGEDELEYAGGIKGKPVELVKCETSDIMVPAEAEMIIEGDVIAEMEEEGPYGEMYGYMGKKHENYYMIVKAITHKKNPWIFNNFTGVTYTTHMLPWQVGNYLKLKKVLPYMVDFYSPMEAIGISIMSIQKRFPGMGISAGQVALGLTTSKIMIVVDDDVDVTNISDVLHAVATRWQPYPASLIIPQTFNMGIDPSIKQRGISSKIVIDATKQLPIEGGPAEWPLVSKVQLEKMAPESFKLVDEKWDEYWKEWKK